MTEQQRVAAISVNLLRIAEWYYKDPVQSSALCQRYLDQSRALGSLVHAPEARQYLQQLKMLSLQPSDGSIPHAAERFLTLGVLLQHPERWMR